MTLPSFFDDPRRADETLRGGKRLTPADAAAANRRYTGPVFPLLGVPIPELFRYRSITLQGGQGSGKTLTVLQLIAPLLKMMAAPFNKQKLIIVDVKGQLTSAVLGMKRVMCPDAPLYLLNPFDRFSHALDPNEFASDPTRIAQLVHALTHRKRDARTDDFFDSSARGHLIDLVKILQTRTRGRWTWRTLSLIATSYDLLEQVLENSRIGRRKADKIVKKTFAGIVSTIESWLDQYSAAFSCWDQSPTFTIETFLRGRGVLILTVPENQADALSPITRLVMRIVKDQLLTDTGVDPHSFATVVFDEFADLGGGLAGDLTEIIYPYFRRSRSANVSLILAWQSWPDVCNSHEEKRMRAILDSVALNVWLGCGFDSAEIASKYCGTAEVRRWEESHALGGEGRKTLSSRTEQRTHVLASEFRGLRPPLPGDLRVRGFLTSSYLNGPLYCEEDYAPFISLLNRLPKVAAVRPRPTADHWLAPWDEEQDGTDLNPLWDPE